MRQLMKPLEDKPVNYCQSKQNAGGNYASSSTIHDPVPTITLCDNL